jgi:hypothetical protein
MLGCGIHAILALSGAAKPSVIRVRIEGLRSKHLAGLSAEACMDELLKGSMVSVSESGVRIRRLPLIR